MGDPTGTLGGAVKKPNDDLFAVVARGGADFTDRIKQLADAREAHDAAFERLQMGQDVLAEKARAKSLLADAESKQRDAGKVLEEARAKAAALIEDAGKAANAAKDAALKDAKTIAAGAVKIKAEADDYAAKAKTQADALVKDTQDAYAQAQQARAASSLAKSKHDDAAAAFLSQKQIAEQTQATLNGKIARLNEVIREVMGD